MADCDDCGLPIEVDGSPLDGEQPMLCSPCASRRDVRIRFTPLGADDLELVLAWRSNPCVYRHFRRQNGPLQWDDHVRWFESRDPERHDFVIHFRGRRVGVVSLDTDGEVSVFVGDISARGQGVATESLRWLSERFDDRTPLFAEIHVENEASTRLFTRCGFEQGGRDGDWLQYVYDPN